MVERYYLHSERLMSVCKNLNTPTKAAFFKVLESSAAQRLLMRCFEFCSMPKNGNWLNIEENELSTPKRLRLQRRAVGS